MRRTYLILPADKWPGEKTYVNEKELVEDLREQDGKESLPEVLAVFILRSGDNIDLGRQYIGYIGAREVIEAGEVDEQRAQRGSQGG